MDWDALSGALGAVLWIVFVVVKKRKRAARREERSADASKRRPRARRKPEAPEFRRDYEPIEPK